MNSIGILGGKMKWVVESDLPASPYFCRLKAPSLPVALESALGSSRHSLGASPNMARLCAGTSLHPPWGVGEMGHNSPVHPCPSECGTNPPFTPPPRGDAESQPSPEEGAGEYGDPPRGALWRPRPAWLAKPRSLRVLRVVVLVVVLGLVSVVMRRDGG